MKGYINDGDLECVARNSRLSIVVVSILIIKKDH